MEKTKEALIELVQEVLEVEGVEATQLTREHQANWDSLKHLEIIMAVEEEFGVRFTPGEIAELQSVEQIWQAISKEGKL